MIWVLNIKPEGVETDELRACSVCVSRTMVRYYLREAAQSRLLLCRSQQMRCTNGANYEQHDERSTHVQLRRNSIQSKRDARILLLLKIYI